MHGRALADGFALGSFELAVGNRHSGIGIGVSVHFLSGNRGQGAFSFIFLKTNSWQVDCGWDLREKGQSHILTYFKLRDPSSDGTSAVRYLKNLPSDSTNSRLANSTQPEGAE
jgi:hypothetical protein